MHKQHIIDALHTLKTQKPLVVNITNYVVMNNTANALLALGASPIMAHSRQEMADMMSIAGALVINIGTLDSEWIERMAFAVEQANIHHKVVVLDPVGCGASTLRTNTSRRFAKLADRLIIRGNSSEIIALAGESAKSKGVDALDSSQDAIKAAITLTEVFAANVVISGATDYIINKATKGKPVTIFALDNGHSMMSLITGMGCSLSALTGAFAAVGETTGLAAAAILGIVGEIAAEQVKGPGSLQVAILDTLYSLEKAEINERLKLTVIDASGWMIG